MFPVRACSAGFSFFIITFVSSSALRASEPFFMGETVVRDVRAPRELATAATESEIAILQAGPGPGDSAQLRGFSKSANEVSVSALGVELQPLQGGGYDLRSFPSYLWSSARFSPGSSHLTLQPWANEAAAQGSGDGRPARLESGLRATSEPGFEFFGRGAWRNSAIVAGQSLGDARATAGAISARMREPFGTEHREWQASVDGLFTVRRAVDSWAGVTREARGVPVVRLDRRQAGEAGHLFLQAFGDAQNLAHESEPSAFQTRDRARQWGARGGYHFTKSARLEAGLRQATYEGLGFRAPDLSEGDLRPEWDFRLGPMGSVWTLAPGVRAVNRYGTLPEPELRARNDDAEWNGSLRFSRRIPTLLDRFYSLPGFYEGNPALTPESKWTLAIEKTFSKTASWLEEWRHELFTERHGDTIVPSWRSSDGVMTMTNAGSAFIVGWRTRARIGLGERLVLNPSASLSKSRVFPSGEAYPLLSAATFRLPITARWMDFEAWLAWRAQSPAAPVAGHAQFDVGLGYSDTRFQAGLRIENLLDRTYVLPLGLPSAGRLLEFTLGAAL